MTKNSLPKGGTFKVQKANSSGSMKITIAQELGEYLGIEVGDTIKVKPGISGNEKALIVEKVEI